MSPDNEIESHIDKMHRVYEKLHALVTSERPLTADDIYATSLVISLPEDWMSCISNLMQLPTTNSSAIVRALKQEATRRKSKIIALPEDLTASKSHVRATVDKEQLPRCTFCNKHSHDLAKCHIASRILKEAKEDYAAKHRGDRAKKGRNMPLANSTRHQPKAGKADFVVLGGESDSDTDEALVGSVKTCVEQVSSASSVHTDHLLDSGCSKSMTPFPSSLEALRPSNAIVRLADDSKIKATARGLQTLPLSDERIHETLLVPGLNVAAKKWSGYKLDFKTAFLNGDLDTKVYMSQPPGFEDPDHPDHVCELSGALYSLKQSPRQWNRKLHSALLSLGLTRSSFDPTLYFSKKSGTLNCTVSVHVDDLAIVGEDEAVKHLMVRLSKNFKVGSKEPLHHFLSLKIERDVENKLVFLSQEHYLDDLRNCCLGSSHTLSFLTPTDLTFKDLPPCHPDEAKSPGPYASLVGALLWAAQCTSSDTSFAVGRLSQFLHDPSLLHWRAALRVLHYLVATKHLRLCLGGNLTMCGYSDSDWAKDRLDRHSTSGYSYHVGLGAISWKSRKQPTISLSTAEAEYKAASDSFKEAVWL